MSTNLISIKQRFDIVGKSKLLDIALEAAVRVSNTDLTVLITGESGTGKEVFSRVIHNLSARKHNDFIAINCGAIPEGTINSELFGHEKGSFTGAVGDRKGYFETVNGGTIFLDEIGDMPLDTQTYLLRILESGEYIRVGASKTLKTNVRVIAATNVDLLEKIRKGRFREDLYYRLNTVPIRVPSLRERPEDIMMLTNKFAYDFSDRYHTKPVELEDQVKLIFQNYSWPGNIRELRNIVEQLSVLSENPNISVDDVQKFLPQLLKRNLPSTANSFSHEPDGYQDREILYKLLFDMKNDLNELKGLLYEVVRSNNLTIPDMSKITSFKSLNSGTISNNSFSNSKEIDSTYEISSDPEKLNPVLLNNPHFEDHEIVDESLSLDNMEKDMIIKSLKKHNGRRKDAADELGISERTLYRKLKQFDLQI
jgi:transcriptional regulator with PAS, ATPase and Fis domain